MLTAQGLKSKSIVCLNSRGVVEDIIEVSNIDSQSGVEFYNGILMPDMVNAHSHLELSYLRGAIEKGGGFARFAQAIGALRGGFSMEQRLDAAEFWDAKMYAEGVGAVGDICNGASTVKLKSRSKILYHNFAELFGLNTSNADVLDGVVADFRALDLPICVTPHSVYSLNKQAFESAVNHSDQSMPLSIHFMESDAEALLFDKRGHLWDWYVDRGSNVDFLDELSPVDRIINNIPSWRKVMLVHCTKISKNDISRLVDHFADNLTCVVCPQSNLYIENSTIDIDVLRSSGCRIAVGTDSLASADSLSMIDQIKVFEDVPLEERLRWVTVNGAAALGIESRMGVIEKGSQTGIVLLSGIDFDTMRLREDAFSRRII